MTRILTSLLIAALLCAGCSGHATSDKTANDIVMSTSIANPVVMVDIIVLTQADGSGNPLWTRGYVEELLDTASAMVGETAAFQLTSYAVLPEPHLYAGQQGDVLPFARAQRRRGRITIIISRPDTEDYAGLTDQAGPQGRPDPYLVMRSRHTDWSGINATAAILLHELAHCGGLFHKPEPFLYNGEIHTDDWWLRDDGLAYMEAYFSRVVGE